MFRLAWPSAREGKILVEESALVARVVCIVLANIRTAVTVHDLRPGTDG